MRYLLFLSLLFLIIAANSVVAQSDSLNHFLPNKNIQRFDSLQNNNLLIADVEIVGNRRTKSSIILREMSLKKGDIISASELKKQLEISRNQVFNTSLFIDVSIIVTNKTGDIISLKIEVKERWYLFPVPYFTLADRNFNQWWTTENRDPTRVNYGIQFTQYNLSGNNDALNLWLINGYSKQISFRYNLPFFNKSLKHGLNVGYSYLTQKELNDSTSLNKQVFIKSNNFLMSFSRADMTYSYRPNQKWRHYFRVGFTRQWIADTVLKATPNYFPTNQTSIQYFDVNYRFRYLNLDYNAYPTKGYSYEGYVYKRMYNKDLSQWQIGASGLYVQPLWHKAFLKLSAAATIKSPENDCYFGKSLFGYNSFSLRGLEYYVIDGDAGLLGQATLTQEIFKSTLHTHLKSRNYNQIPFRYFLKLYGDVGYAHSNYAGNSLLNNRLLYTGGIGLDIVSIYDFIFRIELSFNQLGSQGLYLHSK